MNNQPAFPIVEPGPEGVVSVEPGMTLRDYFAAKAMQSWLIDSFSVVCDVNEHECAKFAYRMADAMLAERKKGEQK